MSVSTSGGRRCGRRRWPRRAGSPRCSARWRLSRGAARCKPRVRTRSRGWPARASERGRFSSPRRTRCSAAAAWRRSLAPWTSSGAGRTGTGYGWRRAPGTRCSRSRRAEGRNTAGWRTSGGARCGERLMRIRARRGTRCGSLGCTRGSSRRARSRRCTPATTRTRLTDVHVMYHTNASDAEANLTRARVIFRRAPRRYRQLVNCVDHRQYFQLTQPSPWPAVLASSSRAPPWPGYRP
mmetsp:Transcript_5246/g.23401  ORF Transcript_5246/g.23401 Transcript_5246/m.23401 type:complete len:238 (-) Transcript_5246:528-1241(-)